MSISSKVKLQGRFADPRAALRQEPADGRPSGPAPDPTPEFGRRQAARAASLRSRVICLSTSITVSDSTSIA